MGLVIPEFLGALATKNIWNLCEIPSILFLRASKDNFWNDEFDDGAM